MPKNYTIYQICGHTPSTIQLLVHGCDTDRPDDWELFTGSVFSKNGEETKLDYYVEEWLTWMWESPSNQELIIVTNSGHIHSRSNKKWNVLDFDEQYSFNRIWGVDEKSVFCCGADGVLLCKQNDKWVRIETDIDDHFVDIGGTGPKDIYIVGKRGKVWYYDSKSFLELEPPTDLHQMAILGISPEEVYTCGRKGTCFRGSKVGWEQIKGTDGNLWDLEQYRGKILVAARNDGILAVEGNSLIPFAKDIVALGLSVIGDHLFAFAGTTMSEFDGTHWITTEIDFAKLTGG